MESNIENIKKKSLLTTINIGKHEHKQLKKLQAKTLSALRN